MSKTCIIIPCYNEEFRLPIDEFFDYLGQEKDVYFCFVDDGSKDRTMDVLRKLQTRFPGQTLVVTLPANAGKAEAVRHGMLRAIKWQPFDWVGYFDADLATPLTEIQLLASFFKKNPSLLMVFGSRVLLLGSTVKRKAYRHYLGRIFSTTASIILHLPVYDTQCGAKLFNQSIVNEIFSAPFSSRWLFDIEIFGRISKNYKHLPIQDIMKEVPLNTWIEKGQSKLSLGYILQIPFELFKIKKNIR